MIGHEEKIRIVIQAVASVLNIGADTVYDDNIAAERKVGLHFRAVMIVKVTDIVWGVVGGTESAKEFPVTKTACIALDGTVFMQQGGILFPVAAGRIQKKGIGIAANSQVVPIDHNFPAS